MLNANNFRTITQLRTNTLEIINSVINDKLPIYIISRSKPKAIIISIEEYGKYLELKRTSKESKSS